MANPATIVDVEDRWRPLAGNEPIIAQTLLDDAWAMLQARSTGIVARIAAVPATVDVVLVRMVLAQMVIRVLRNPDGRTQESIEDYSYSMGQAAAAGYLYVTGDELDMLDLTDTSSNAFTIRPYGAPDTTTTTVGWL